jgi:hypothetical protein
MSPEIIACEQKKNKDLKEVMKKSDKFSERIVERSTVITYDNNIYTNIPQEENSMVVSYIPPTSGDNQNGSYTETKSNLAQP